MRLRDNPDAVLSPYLRDHISNPVDWWQWDDDAFADARERNVPIMLSVGYAACHWCHVMAHESFEDADTARQLNEGFVSIKVDREERPDIDAVYMQVTQELTGQGGWPMTVFIDHQGRAFYAGTYYPPTSRGGMPSFRQVLDAVTDAWTNRREELENSAASIAAALERRDAVPLGDGEYDAVLAAHAVTTLERQFDAEFAGFGGAPKFPPSSVLQFLARHATRTQSPSALAMFRQTCEAMAFSGMFDQLGGGFARYSVDREWVVPHFEKMLYDNAQLISVYTNWYRLGGCEVAAQIVRESIDFLLRELRTSELGFASALDADSEGREGAFYVWTRAELIEVLGDEDGAWAAQVFEVTEAGTFEDGASTLQLRPSFIDDADRLNRVRAALFEARATRVRPACDDKVVAAWNGLTIGALAEAGAVFGRPDWIAAARDCALFVWTTHTNRRADDTIRLARVSRGGVVGASAGVLEDYGDLAQGLLVLYAATGEGEWFNKAHDLVNAALAHFGTAEGGFYDTADDAEQLVQRPRDPFDNAYPSGFSAMVGALLTYAAYSGDLEARDRVQHALDLVSRLMTQAPRFAGWSLAIGEALLDGPREVALVGSRGDGRYDGLLDAFWQAPTVGAVLAQAEPSRAPAVPLLADRGLVDGLPAAYVCRDFVCALPVTEAAALTALLGANT